MEILWNSQSDLSKSSWFWSIAYAFYYCRPAVPQRASLAKLHALLKEDVLFATLRCMVQTAMYSHQCGKNPCFKAETRANAPPSLVRHRNQVKEIGRKFENFVAPWRKISSSISAETRRTDQWSDGTRHSFKKTSYFRLKSFVFPHILINDENYLHTFLCHNIAQHSTEIYTETSLRHSSFKLSSIEPMCFSGAIYKVQVFIKAFSLSPADNIVQIKGYHLL